MVEVIEEVEVIEGTSLDYLDDLDTLDYLVLRPRVSLLADSGDQRCAPHQSR